MSHYSIDGEVQVKSAAFAKRVARRLAEVFDIEMNYVKTEGTKLCISDNHIKKPDSQAAALLDSISIYIVEGIIYIGTGNEPSCLRYHFREDKGRFVREKKSWTLWGTEDPCACCGKGTLAISKEFDGDEEARKSVLSVLEDLFTDVCAEGRQVSVSFEGPIFGYECTASRLETIAKYISSGTICVGMRNDGPFSEDARRWKYSFKDGAMTFQEGNISWKSAYYPSRQLPTA